jgi:glycosyltransferase involved in cell wall biosynthesis
LPENRVEIVHVDVANLPEQARMAPNETVLAIFWSNDAPVGQVYARADYSGRIGMQALWRAIRAGGESLPLHATVSRDGSQTATIVICTRDRPEALTRCLTSLHAQTRKPDQIVVVDNASRDDRTERAAAMAGVDYVREERTGLDIARNTGAFNATGHIIAYADDDVRLHPRWLERLVSAFDAEEVMAVTGLVLPAELETRAQLIFEQQWGFGRGFCRIDFDSAFFERNRDYGCPVWQIGAGANMAFRRCAFAEVGYFDERLDVGAAGCSGDSEYWYRLLAAGWTCRYEPSAVAFHYHRREYESLARQIFAYMRGHTAALLVQFERHGHQGNLRRTFLTLPTWYAKKAVHRFWHGVDDTNCLLSQEVRGALAGIIYYLRTKWHLPGSRL